MKRVLRRLVRQFTPAIDATPSGYDYSYHNPRKRFWVMGEGVDGEGLGQFSSLKKAQTFLEHSTAQLRKWPELHITEALPEKELLHEVHRNIGVFKKQRIPLNVLSYAGCVWACDCEVEYLCDGVYGKIACCCADNRRQARRSLDPVWTALLDGTLIAP